MRAIDYLSSLIAGQKMGSSIPVQVCELEMLKTYLEIQQTMAEGRAALAKAQQGEQQPVCHGCGIPAGDVHMSTCKSGKWPSRVSNGDTAAPAPQVQDKSDNYLSGYCTGRTDLLKEQSAQPEDGCAPNHMCNGHRVHIPTGECCNKCGATSW